MYRIFLATLLTLAPTLLAAQRSPEEAGVRAAIEQYFRGHATADSSDMRKAFLPTAHVEGVRDGRFASWTLTSTSAA